MSNRDAARRRVLIVTSGFPPAILSDMHRARQLADDLPAAGWDVEILAPSVEFQHPLWIEPDSIVLSQDKTPVHLARPDRMSILRAFGIQSLGWRAFGPMNRAGRNLLRSRRFDLVFISTTQFNFFLLGMLWFRRFKIPYVLDFQDPWAGPRTKYSTTRRRWKFTLTRWLANVLERLAVKHAAGIIAVSASYIEQLRSRYPRAIALQASRAETIPFSASVRDFTAASPEEITDSSFADIVYVGAGGSIMAKSFRRIMELVAQIRDTEPALLNSVRIRLFGTYAYWKPGQPRELLDIAAELKMSDLVSEAPARISYVRAIGLIRKASGLLILGVDDPAYMPSKLFLYAAAGKPLLASLHEKSQAIRYFQDLVGLGHLIRFDGSGSTTNDLQEMRTFLQGIGQRRQFDRLELIAPFLSPAAARRHAQFFERLLSA